MAYQVGYFLRAPESVYSVIRAALPSGMHLVTLTGPGQELERVRELDFVISVRMNAEVIEAGRRLRLLQLPGVGYDQVDMAAAKRVGLPVAQSLGGSSDAVAEHALMLMLAVSRRLVELAVSLRAGKWWMWERRTVSYGLQGKTLGIIGLGRIGSEVAVRAAGFGMTIQHHDAVPSPRYPFADLQTLLRTSDIVSIHCPLTAETRHLLNADRIGTMKPGAILINTARGGIVDEAALYQALVAGHLAGAGLDVFEKEPPGIDNPLLHLDQVIATPHVSTGTFDSLRAKAAFYAENIRRVLDGKPPLGLLNVE